MHLDVQELLFDDENEAKLASHGVSILEVLQVLDEDPKFFTNAAGRRASHVMLGPTYGGRLLVVAIEHYRDGLWRPVTGFDATAAQATKYRSA